MIREFPADHELMAFFDAAPAMADPSTPWLYNILEFATSRDGVEVRCEFWPSEGGLTTRLFVADVEVAKFEFRNAAVFRFVEHQGRTRLVAEFDPHQRVDSFVLQLEPNVWAGWGNAGQIP
jgi:hypothetical protein